MRSNHVADGVRLLALGQPTEAARAFMAALSENPRQAEAFIGAARASIAAGHPESAEVALRELLALEPQNLDAQAELAALKARGGDEAALQSLRELAHRSGARNRVLLASVLFARGDSAGAATAIQQAVRVEPGSAELRLELGRLLLSERRATEAVAEFHAAAELLPDDGFPLLLEARALAADGQVKPALQVLTLARDRAPEEPAVFRDLFKLCLLDGNPKGALRAAGELQALLGETAEVAYLEGLARTLAGDPAGATERLREALRRDPQLWSAEHALAKAELLLHREPEALQILEKLVDAHPDEPGPANDLATLYFGMLDGRRKAAPLLRRVLAKHPHDAATTYNLALALSETDRAQALDLAQRAQAAAGELGANARRLVEALRD